MVTGSPNGVTGAPSVRNSIRGSRLVRHAGALAGYAAVMGVALLPKVLPVRHGQILSNSPADGAIFLWSLGWWSHAIAHGSFLPYTHALYAPTGTNLAWTTSIELPGIILAPVTRLFGVVAAFNVLSVLAPVTAGWLTYLLLHDMTGHWLSSFAGGLLFAVSPLELTEVAIGHLNLTLTALVPAAATLVVRRLHDSLSARAFVLLLGGVLAAQAAISTEVLVTGTLVGALALVLFAAWDRERRPAVGRCAALAALGYLVAGILSTPLLYAALAMPHPVGLASAGSPLPMSGVRTVVPSATALRADLLHPSRGDSAVAVLILAIPLALILVDLLRRRWREPAIRALAVTGAAVLACSVGVLVVGGREVPTPWAAVTHLGFLRLIRPQRLTMYFWLIAAVGVGTWLAERPASRGRLGLVVLAVAAMVLPLSWGTWTSVIPPSPLGVGAWSPIGLGDSVLVVSSPGSASQRFDDLAFPTVWQVESNFSFRLADAYVGSFAPALPGPVNRLVFGKPPLPGDAAALQAWIRSAHVTWFLVVRPSQAVIGSVEALVGSAPLWRGGVALFRVGGPSGQR